MDRFDVPPHIPDHLFRLYAQSRPDLFQYPRLAEHGVRGSRNASAVIKFGQYDTVGLLDLRFTKSVSLGESLGKLEGIGDVNNSATWPAPARLFSLKYQLFVKKFTLIIWMQKQSCLQLY